jgi:hypothetical protein
MPLAGYARATKGERIKALKGINLLRTWCKDKGKDIATTVPPAHLKGKKSTCGSGGFQSAKQISYCL